MHRTTPEEGIAAPEAVSQVWGYRRSPSVKKQEVRHEGRDSREVEEEAGREEIGKHPENAG